MRKSTHFEENALFDINAALQLRAGVTFYFGYVLYSMENYSISLRYLKLCCWDLFES